VFEPKEFSEKQQQVTERNLHGKGEFESVHEKDEQAGTVEVTEQKP
jgi:hypothetical protein